MLIKYNTFTMFIHTCSEQWKIDNFHSEASVMVYCSSFKYGTQIAHTFSAPKDCLDIQRSGKNKSDIYTIYPNFSPVEVRCDMDTEGGGWTVSSDVYVVSDSF